MPKEGGTSIFTGSLPLSLVLSLSLLPSPPPSGTIRSAGTFFLFFFPPAERIALSSLQFRTHRTIYAAAAVLFFSPPSRRPVESRRAKSRARDDIALRRTLGLPAKCVVLLIGDRCEKVTCVLRRGGGRRRRTNTPRCCITRDYNSFTLDFSDETVKRSWDRGVMRSVTG